MLELSDGERILTISRAVLTQYRFVTDRETDGHIDISRKEATPLRPMHSNALVTDAWTQIYRSTPA